ARTKSAVSVEHFGERNTLEGNDRNGCLAERARHRAELAAEERVDGSVVAACGGEVAHDGWRYRSLAQPGDVTRPHGKHTVPTRQVDDDRPRESLTEQSVDFLLVLVRDRESSEEQQQICLR